MPISKICVTKGPNYIFPGDSLMHMSVLSDVFIIIKNQKIMAWQLPVGRKDYRNQKQTNDKIRTCFFYDI
jgi:hypothetical protein